MTRRPALATLALVSALGFTGVSARAASDIDPATGYRVQNYRAPVTEPVEGGTRADLADVDRLVGQGGVLIDVMPQRGGYDPATGSWRLVDRRQTIPGAVWLPEVGRGVLDPRIAPWFARWLDRLTAGDRDRPLVFFCMADCWMSWNAVKRAHALGYRNVHWFADGTDGWREADRPLVEGEPAPVLDGDPPPRSAGR
ncbi:PQQ-dependent catabolism-associated CXXCW motif protein [Methylobacterium sp. UNC300MFChir4.1]|uniref:rhodanese-like domain-containing protein n=1 Tax=Methylobacterium sp. UNC300MFChir4.1 TaxID=1502747 RepID=UPI0008D4E330|nr:rhodanese-like domain-containing protein [Methylobacterium sp. UNC300MFChir4.1]SEP39433.1 PQQ-dependent catabolism-associated CXXCW motif protein [Methylobacterium sp. UNC300MFChir4.1]